MLYIIFLLLSLLSTITYQTQLTLTVYYETECPDSKRFITKQLFPTWTRLGGWNNPYLKIEYVPYGHASTTIQNNVYTFDCQHGWSECYGNKMHSCALHHLNAASRSPFVACSMAASNPSFAGQQCAQKLNLTGTYGNIETCLHSRESSELLAKHGNKTNELIPQPHYIPWITYNGTFSRDDLQFSELNLLNLVCYKLRNESLPTACKK